MDQQELELLGLKIDPVYRADEPALYATKWIEYRWLHPVDATMVYINLWNFQVQEFTRRNYDARDAERMLPEQHDPAKVFDTPHAASFWLARQCCDRQGIPYWFALNYAHARFVDRHYHHYPRPNQMYGEEFEWDSRDAWQQWCSTQLVYSKVPAVVARAEHAEFVLNQVKARQGPKEGLLGRMLKESILTEDQVRSVFGEQTLDRALRVRAALVGQ